jgi:hypothetical protein
VCGQFWPEKPEIENICIRPLLKSPFPISVPVWICLTISWRTACENTRGLMELVVLNVGLDLGVLSPTLFAMFVLMAVVTTLATTPVLQALAE